MFNTQDFKTKSFIWNRNNPKPEGFHPISIDIGYSAVKGLGPNNAFIFPSYAKKITGEILTFNKKDEKEDIYYRDDLSGEVFAVGFKAEKDMSIDDTNDNYTSLYGRNRYSSDMYKILLRVGLALGLKGYNKTDKIKVQTGLPTDYKKIDEPAVIKAFSGSHKFSIKLGAGEFESFDFNLDKEDISVIEQPLGTLFSISTLKDGRPSENAVKYFNSKMVVVDIGFGTLDTYSLKNGAVESLENHTYDYLGMKSVFERTFEKIYKETGMAIPVHMIQNYLQSGFFTLINREELSTKKVAIAKYLEEASKEIYEKAIAKISLDYNNFFEKDYLVIAGGTGDCWFYDFRKHFSKMETLKVISCTANDSLPATFANARGYYMFLYKKLQAAAQIK